MTNILFKEESYRIIGACMEVHKELSSGFNEKVYQEAAVLEFITRGIPFKKELAIDITYKGELLPRRYVADFLCYDNIILEFKAVTALHDEHFSQVISYLKASNKNLGLLINFGSQSLSYRRVVY